MQHDDPRRATVVARALRPPGRSPRPTSPSCTTWWRPPSPRCSR